MNTAQPPPGIGATVLGYPRIGPRREVKFALEAYWAGRSDRTALLDVAAAERRRTWSALHDMGLDSVPSNTFSLYDQVLDAAVMVNVVPERHAATYAEDPLAGYFAMARGTAEAAPLEMTKWFDTNYHYLVPEVGPETEFRLDASKPLAEYAEAAEQGLHTRPVVLGPVTFLALSKPTPHAPDGFTPTQRLADLVPVYVDLLRRLADAGAAWVQFDEPALVRDLDTAELDALADVYRTLGEQQQRPALFVASYFGRLGAALPVLAKTPVEAIGVDVTRGTTGEEVAAADLTDTQLVAGVVDGRNVWRTDLRAAVAQVRRLADTAAAVAVATSCSLLHVPYTLRGETRLADELRPWLAFAEEKVAEVVTVQRGLVHGEQAIAEATDAADQALADRRHSPLTHDEQVRARLAALTPEHRERGAYEHRRAEQRQRLNLPPLPTTTIGSFPQTGDIRAARAGFRAGRVSEAEYRRTMRAEIERVVRLQESLGLDVLVHGEPERNDMVQYFAELLDGFATTANGWVQSYGSRCVRPPILYGDVRRDQPMTVPWLSYAQSLTDRPVKGMLTGPVTILAWSFIRDDQPAADTALQVALAVRDETVDLQQAGLSIVQVDEPALRELLPLRRADQKAYLQWAVDAFRVATSGVADGTQVHTHLCYSEFGEVVSAIDELGADVTSIEAARSKMEVLPALTAGGMSRGVGPGVYDIHSPRVPDAAEVAGLLSTATRTVPPDRLWVNPDCGLKTRGYDETAAALQNLVTAARRLRSELSVGG